MKLILIRSPQLLFYKMKSKKKTRTRRRIQLQFHTITMSNRRIYYEKKSYKKMKTINNYYRKNALSAFLKEIEEDELIILVHKEL